MTGFPRSPRLIKGGIVLLDPQNYTTVLRVIVLQYNPDTLSRTLQVQASGGDGGERSEALRLKGPPVETFTVEAAIDGTDQIEVANPGDDVLRLGIFPQLASLETLIYPTVTSLEDGRARAGKGEIEIVAPELPLTLFVWSSQRVMPVRLTEFSATEEAFDPALNPIRATVRLGMRVLSVTDLGYAHKGSDYFMSYLRNKEVLKQRVAASSGAAALQYLNLSSSLLKSLGEPT